MCALLYNRIQILSVSGSYSAALIMMWLYTVLYSMSALLTVYANRKGRYNRLFINPIIGSIANFIVAIPLGLLGFGYEGFMLTYIIQYLCVCIHMMWGDFPFKRNYRFKDFIHVIVTYRDYIFYQYPANFIVNFGNEYPTQYFGRIFNAQQLGSYSMCVRIMKYPIRLIGGIYL